MNMNVSMSCRAAGTINRCRFVKPATAADHSALQSAEATILPLGISTDQVKTRPDPDIAADPNIIAAVTGDPIKVFVAGAICSLDCAAAWTAGDLLMPDGSGKGIVATTGNYYGARALTAGTVGSLCTVQVISGYKA